MMNWNLDELIVRFPVWLAILAAIVLWVHNDEVFADPQDVVTTGAMYNGVCYSSNAVAADAYFSSVPPQYTLLSATNEAYVIYQKVSGVWMLNDYTFSNTGGTVTLDHSTIVPVPTFPVCNYDPDYSPSAMAINENVQITNMQTAVSGIQQSMTQAATAASSVAQSIAGSSTFDLTNALAAFAFFFSSVILLFMVSSSAGEIIRLIKNGE